MKCKHPPEYAERDSKRFCEIDSSSSCQTITMTLKQSLHPTNSNKVMEKLNQIVPQISSAMKVLNYFLNWYATEYKQLFPLYSKFAQNHLELLMKVILGQKERIRQDTFGKYPYLFEPLELFLSSFPNFQLQCPLECHQSMMNLACIQLHTNLNLYHLQFFDLAYLKNQIIKAIKAKIIENTPNEKEWSEEIKRQLTPERLKAIETQIQLKLDGFEDVRHPALEDKYEMMCWINRIKADSKLRTGYFYPLGGFKDNMIALDLKSFLKMMNCSFSEAFQKHATKCEKGNRLIETTNIRTDGYSVQFVKRYTFEKPKYTYEVEWFNKKEQKWVLKSKTCKMDKTEGINARDKPSFDRIKKFKCLPSQDFGTRVLAQVAKLPENQSRLAALGKCAIDPGKKQVYTVLSEEGSLKTVAMSKERLKHLRLTRVFQAIELNNRKHLSEFFDEMSRCHCFSEYIQVVHRYFKQVRHHYGTKTNKKMRFKRFQIEQKILDLMYKEIQGGQVLATNMSFKDKVRKKARYKKVKKKVIYYGDGSYKHNSSGCESVMNKKLVYALSKRTLVIMTPEFRTSKSCSNCHHLNETSDWITIKSRKHRLRQCQHCHVTMDRDVNAVFNIMQVVEHYLLFNTKPSWQLR